MNTISGQFVDIQARSIYPASISWQDGVITNIERLHDAPAIYIMPGFVDAHIHIENSMLVPSKFARIAVQHGTVATVSDPHEIANVCGIAGIQYMIDNAAEVPLKFHFGAPSCVPATNFETAGASLSAEDVATLLSHPDIYYLAELMNFPGVMLEDASLMQMIHSAKQNGKPIDGHAPGLRLPDSEKYFRHGISTDHECTVFEEALEKIGLGSYVLIREGSAAKNYEALHPIFNIHPDKIMFCSDDKHPDDLLESHINALVVSSVALGYDLYDVLQAACVTPVRHYGLDVGLLQINDPADFILVEDLKTFNIRSTFINGQCVFNGKEILFEDPIVYPINNFNIHPISPEVFRVKTNQAALAMPIIEAIDGALLTRSFLHDMFTGQDHELSADEAEDILKIAVINRYEPATVFTSFIHGFGLKSAAIASSVAHDSHNIIVVGTDDALMAAAANAIIQHRGGISYADYTNVDVLPLPIAGLMSDGPAEEVAAGYARLTEKSQAAGSKLTAPYMTLSFMALPVIPSLKITDKGLVDVDSFTLFNPIES